MRGTLVMLALFGVASTAAAQTVTLTFEGVVNTIYTAPIVRGGYRIGNPPGFEQHFHEIQPCCGLPSNGTGVLLNDRDSEIFVILDAGGTFTLDMVDVAASLGNLPADGLEIREFLANSPTGTIIIPSLGTGYTSVNGSMLGTVDEIRFDGIGGGGGFLFDNATLTEAGSCYADCDGSGSLDFFDFLCFQNEFANGTSYADCDGSGSLDFFDFLCFQNEFAGGCP